MSVRSGLAAARRQVLGSLYRRPASLGNCAPLVSFTFDDFPRSAYLAGGAILERFGARGTYYAAPGLMNTCNEIGEQFRAEDLDSLLENGHELGSHTFSHVSCRAVACAEFREDVKRGSKAIEEMTGQDSPNFAYPFGHITLPAKRSLGQGIASLRSIFPGFNGPEVDLNLLRANSLYGDFNDHEWADELIRENVERNSWLIFYTHDVDSQPSAYGCTPELLEAAVSCALDCGCRILTVREALAESGVQNGNPKGHAPCAVSV